MLANLEGSEGCPRRGKADSSRARPLHLAFQSDLDPVGTIDYGPDGYNWPAPPIGGFFTSRLPRSRETVKPFGEVTAEHTTQYRAA